LVMSFVLGLSLAPSRPGPDLLRAPEFLVEPEATIEPVDLRLGEAVCQDEERILPGTGEEPDSPTGRPESGQNQHVAATLMPAYLFCYHWPQYCIRC